MELIQFSSRISKTENSCIPLRNLWDLFLMSLWRKTLWNESQDTYFEPGIILSFIGTPFTVHSARIVTRLPYYSADSSLSIFNTNILFCQQLAVSLWNNNKLLHFITVYQLKVHPTELKCKVKHPTMLKRLSRLKWNLETFNVVWTLQQHPDHHSFRDPDTFVDLNKGKNLPK